MFIGSEKEVTLGHRQFRGGRGSMSSPSTRTANVSLSTSIAGSASFSGRLALPTGRDTSSIGTRRRSTVPARSASLS